MYNAFDVGLPEYWADDINGMEGMELRLHDFRRYIRSVLGSVLVSLQTFLLY